MDIFPIFPSLAPVAPGAEPPAAEAAPFAAFLDASEGAPSAASPWRDLPSLPQVADRLAVSDGGGAGPATAKGVRASAVLERLAAGEKPVVAIPFEPEVAVGDGPVSPPTVHSVEPLETPPRQALPPGTSPPEADQSESPKSVPEERADRPSPGKPANPTDGQTPGPRPHPRLEPAARPATARGARAVQVQAFIAERQIPRPAAPWSAAPDDGAETQPVVAARQSAGPCDPAVGSERSPGERTEAAAPIVAMPVTLVPPLVPAVDAKPSQPDADRLDSAHEPGGLARRKTPPSAGPGPSAKPAGDQDRAGQAGFPQPAPDAATPTRTLSSRPVAPGESGGRREAGTNEPPPSSRRIDPAGPALSQPPAGIDRAPSPVRQAAYAPPGTATLALDRDFATHVGISVARRVGEGAGDVSVRMDPPELGRVEVRLAFDDEGSLRAIVSADSSVVLDTLRRDSGDLHRALADAGIRTDGQSFRFDRQGQGGQDSGQTPRWSRPAATLADPAGEPQAETHHPLRRSSRLDLMA